MKRAAGSRQERDRLVRTVCQECSVACGLVASVKDGRVVDVQGDERHPVSRGRLCARGTAFVQGLTAPERLTAPAARTRSGDALQPLDGWKTGVDLLAERLRVVRERHGPEALAIACDRDAGLEFLLGARRFARLWGTPHVLSAAAPHEPWPGGGDAPTAPCTEWIHAGCLLLVGADLAATHPVAFGWVQEAQRRGAAIVAADARFTATLAKADLALRIRPGQGNVLGLALARLLAARPGDDGPLSEGDPGRRPPEQGLDGAEAALGVSLDDLRHLAGVLATRAPVTVVTGRALVALPHHRVWLALARAMGWLARPGGGWYPLDAGTPALAVEDEGADRGAAVPAADPAGRGAVRALICSGGALAEHGGPLEALADAAEVVAHFGAFPGATRERASLSFPATLWAERDGLFFGGDRSVEWGRAIVEAPAGCRSGLEFWCELARRFGWQEQFPWAGEDGRADPGAFWGWLLPRSAATAGVDLEQVRTAEPPSRCSWPAGDGAAALHAAAVAPPPAPASLADAAPSVPGYPLALVAVESSVRSGEASRFWSWTRSLGREDAVELHPDTARRLGIESGAEVLVETPGGTRAGRATVSRAVARWAVGWTHAGAGPAALVRRTDQSADEARALLDGWKP